MARRPRESLLLTGRSRIKPPVSSDPLPTLILWHRPVKGSALVLWSDRPATGLSSRSGLAFGRWLCAQRPETQEAGEGEHQPGTVQECALPGVQGRTEHGLAALSRQSRSHVQSEYQ